jgi:hypothetical protein
MGRHLFQEVEGRRLGSVQLLAAWEGTCQCATQRQVALGGGWR